MRRKNVFVLGSTGTIGRNTLKVVEAYPGRFRVVGLSAHQNVRQLARQVKAFRPRYVAVGDPYVAALRTECGTLRSVHVGSVLQDLPAMVAQRDVDIVVVGMSGRAALETFLSAVRAGKRVAPANKEVLVIAGEIVMAEARRNGARVIPVDSEQSAIFQCLEGQRRDDLKKVILTASGGPLRGVPLSRFSRLKKEDILAHPRWRMGPKITVDSATLMNKGFEVIEALRLFDLSLDEIEVLVHPEAIVHSMVQFRDGSLLAQCGPADMRLPIQYALTYPQRWDSQVKPVDFTRLGQMTFQRPDRRKFPCLDWAFAAAREGGTAPAVLNAADEVIVQAFLEGRIRFDRIFSLIPRVMARHRNQRLTMASALRADAWAREEAAALLARESTGRKNGRCQRRKN